MSSNVLYVTTSTSIGGAEKTLHLLATGLQRHKALGVVCLKDPGPWAGKLQEAGVPVWSLGMGRLPSPATFQRLRTLLLEKKPDLVHAFLYAGMELARAVKASGVDVPLISSPRVTFRTRTQPMLLVDSALKGQDDLLIAESDASAAFFTGSLGYDASKVTVIRNGVERAPALSDAERTRIRASYGVSDGELLLACVGRLDPQKGQMTLIKALASAPGKLILVGDGPDRAELEDAAAELDLSARCRLVGEQPGFASRLGAFDLVVQPSLWEGTPNTVLEAMAAGRPVIASEVDGVREVIDDGRTGRLVPPGDPEALAAAITELADPAARERLGREARAFAERELDLGRMIAAYEDAYASLKR